ncbi:ferritin-like domain-containing protein [Halosolutus halophilus]|uniref:ferritin-like domain-containing protein n=1 Tax=Halosolutus halophilus TaxID=1552990 RepID=UPI00223523DD|nr:ferritin-like domain-containing protein [Halosolutus halophilus]
MSNESSRRRVLAASAVLSAGALGGVSAVAADDHVDSDKRKGDEKPVDEPPEAVPDEFANDIEILNFARLLEFLEATFYTRGIRNISEQEFRAAVEEYGVIQDRVVNRFRVIRDHEITHAQALGETVELLGGEPIAAPEFDFGTAVQDPDEFIATGAQLEDVGVSAYAGAAPSIESAELIPPALSIHSVEARHASFLRELNDEIGFPTPFDQPRSRSEVEELASQFIVG